MTTSSPDVPRCRRHTLDLSFLLNGDTTMKQLSQKQAALTLKVSKKIYNFKDELKALFDSSQATSSRVNRLVNGILEAIQCETNTAVDDFRGFIFNVRLYSLYPACTSFRRSLSINSLYPHKYMLAGHSDPRRQAISRSHC